MANFVITNYETPVMNTVGEAQDLIELYLEGVVNTQVIVSEGVVPSGSGFVGYVMHRT